MTMENTVPNKAEAPELDRWLTCESRCFGDKGDVEDITEGQPKWGLCHHWNLPC